MKHTLSLEIIKELFLRAKDLMRRLFEVNLQIVVTVLFVNLHWVTLHGQQKVSSYFIKGGKLDFVSEYTVKMFSNLFEVHNFVNVVTSKGISRHEDRSIELVY